MKRIAIDMDEVMADFTSKCIRLIKETCDETIEVSDFLGKKIREVRPDLIANLKHILSDPSYFRDLAVMPNSQEVIQELAERYEIFITTAAMEFPSSFNAKYEWLKEHFAFLHDLNFVFCGDKSIIHADYLIDDNARHFKRFSGQGILYTSYHNVNETGYVRVNNWLEVKEYFDRVG